MRRSLVAVLSVLLLSAAAFSQEFRGTISGLVNDPSGAAIPGAKIVVTEVRTGTVTQTTSDSGGQYTVPFLLPGQYTVSAQVQGFKEFLRKEINLGSGDHPVIDIRLEVGDTSQSIEVTGDVPQRLRLSHPDVLDHVPEYQAGRFERMGSLAAEGILFLRR